MFLINNDDVSEKIVISRIVRNSIIKNCKYFLYNYWLIIRKMFWSWCSNDFWFRLSRSNRWIINID